MNDELKYRYGIKPYDFRNKADCIRYFKDNLLNKTLTMFKYKNLPESMEERELELILQLHGYGIITEFENELVALWGTYTPPLDIYYRPKNIRVVNPWVNIDKEYEIYKDKDAILIRNDPLDKGLLDIINKYGTWLTEVDLTLFIAGINARNVKDIIANDDNEKASAERYLDNIEKGKLGSMVSSQFGEGIGVIANNSMNGYITQIIELEQYLQGKFLNEIGLNANYNMKRERLSSNETELNEDCLRPLVDSMLEEREKFVEKVNKKYGTNIEVEFNSAWAKYNDEVPAENTDEEQKEEQNDEPMEGEENGVQTDKPTDAE